jgi:hypothetical protein
MLSDPVCGALLNDAMESVIGGLSWFAQTAFSAARTTLALVLPHTVRHMDDLAAWRLACHLGRSQGSCLWQTFI